MKLENDTIIISYYAKLHISHDLHFPLGYMRIYSHQLHIETYHHIPRDKRICRLCNIELETQRYFIFICLIYYEIWGQFPCLFRVGAHTLKSRINYEDKKCVTLYIREATCLRQKVIIDRSCSTLSSRLVTSYFQLQEDMNHKHNMNIEDFGRITRQRIIAKSLGMYNALL